MHKRFLVTLFALSSLALSGLAAASPALDLFNQATYYITSRYNGFSNAPYQDFATQYRPALDAACAGLGETCPYSAAVPIVSQMLETISDGHSYLLNAAQRDEVQRQRSGLGPNAPRMGIVTREIPNSTDRLIADVWESSPAMKAGLRRGDRLVSLNGQLSNDLGADFQPSIAKAVGSGASVRLGVLRAGEPLLEVSLRGETLSARLPTLKTLSPGVGYLRIPSFDVIGKVASAVHQLVRRAQGSGVKRLIVDVRDNPGGVDFEVLAAAGGFVKRTGFTQEYRDSSRTQIVVDGKVQLTNGVTVYDTPGAALFTGKLAVLVNSHSYSGAEYLAQFVQDAKKGIIVGEPSGGLGNTGSTEFNLPDGSALVLTIFKSLRLDGSYLPDRVTPDEIIPDELEQQERTGRDAVLERALELLK
jgi:carboxyl-terminal processing protease